MSDADIIVIGAGIVGAACAHALARRALAGMNTVLGENHPRSQEARKLVESFAKP